MCGIAGFIAKIDKGCTLNRMMNRIKHRGPDDEKCVCYENFQLGFNRLGFVDGKDALQPVETKNWIGAITGEIYNWCELNSIYNISKTETSDCHLLLNAISVHGFSFLNKVDGMFAGVFYDKTKKEIVLFRDFLGQIPLYYCLNEGCFYFSNEYKAFAPEIINLTLNRKAITNYLRSYNKQGTESFIKGVFEVLPGEVVSFLSNDNTVCRKFWYQNDSFPMTKLSDFSTIISKGMDSRFFHNPLPFAFSISGGIDSTLMGHFLAKISNSDSDNNGYHCSNSETDPETLRLCEIMSDIGSRITVLTPDEDDVYESFEAGCFVSDEPSFWLQSHTWAVQKYMDKKFRLCFHGMGPDEFLMGYDIFDKIFHVDNFSDWLKKVSQQIFFLESVGSVLTDDFKKNMEPSDRVIQKWIEELGIFSGISNGLESCRLFINFCRFSTFSQACSIFNKFSMFFSREVRYPFMTKELYQYGLSQPFSNLRQNGFGKIPLRKMSAEIFGENFAGLSKMGQSYSNFLFYNEKNFKKMRNLFQKSRMEELGIIKKDGIDELFESIIRGQKRDLLLFGLCSVEYWLRFVLEGKYGINSYKLD